MNAKRCYLYDVVVKFWYPWMNRTLFVDHIMIKAKNWNDALNQFMDYFTSDYFEDCYEVMGIELVHDCSKGDF